MRLLRIFILSLVVFALTATCLPAGAETVVPFGERISDDQARRSLAELYWWSKKPRQAAAIYGRLLEKKPHDINLILGLMRAQLALGYHDQVLATASRLAVRDITDLKTLTELAWLEADLGHPGQSKKYFQKALGLTNDRRSLELEMAEAMNLWGDFYRTEAIYRKYPAENPTDKGIKVKLARVLMSAQRFEDSEGLYLKLIKQDPLDKKASVALVELKWEEKDFDECLKWAAQILRRWPDEPTALDMQGRVYLRKGKYAQAYESFSRLAELKGHKAQGLTGMGRACLGLKEPDKAGGLFRRALMADPNDLTAPLLLFGKRNRRVPRNLWASSPKTAPSRRPRWSSGPEYTPTTDFCPRP